MKTPIFPVKQHLPGMKIFIVLLETTYTAYTNPVIYQVYQALYQVYQVIYQVLI